MNSSTTIYFDNFKKYTNDTTNALANVGTNATQAGYNLLKVGTQALLGVGAFDYGSGKVCTAYAASLFTPQTIATPIIKGAFSLLTAHPAAAFAVVVAAPIVLHPEAAISLAKNIGNIGYYSGEAVYDAGLAAAYGVKAITEFGKETIKPYLENTEKEIEMKDLKVEKPGHKIGSLNELCNALEDNSGKEEDFLSVDTYGDMLNDWVGIELQGDSVELA